MQSCQMLFENMKSPGFTIYGSPVNFHNTVFIRLLYYRLCYLLRDQGQTCWSIVLQFFPESFLYLRAMPVVCESSDIVAVMISFKS